MILYRLFTTMFPSMTSQVSTRLSSMAYNCISAILLLTSVFINTSHAAPIQDEHYSQFWEVMHNSENLFNVHHAVYNQFRSQRLHPDTVLENMVIEGFPNFRSISPIGRLNVGMQNLTATDRAFFNLLLSTMRHVREDETLFPGTEVDGFLQEFEDIITNLENLLHHLDKWISLNGIVGEDQLEIKMSELAWPDVQEFERTLHAVYVLQEMDRFIPIFRADFTRLFYRSVHALYHLLSPSEDAELQR